jgi:sulfur carrier protein
VKVRLRNPDRDVDLAAGRKVHEILDELGIDANAVLVIRAGELVTREVRVEDADELEIRPVISGGARDRAVAATGIRR